MDTKEQNMKDQLVKDIVDIEWDMFSSVNNMGGKASCQTQPLTFELMRRSQLQIWDEPLLESYLADLKAAKQEGRNLMTEKYARMMEFSHPDEFAAVRDALPCLDAEAVSLVADIVKVNLDWKADVDARFPHLAGQGRILRTKDEVCGYSSVETYLAAELKTYSVKTLRLLKKWTEERLAQGINDAELNLLSQIRGYGFSSLEEAERAVAAGR